MLNHTATTPHGTFSTKTRTKLLSHCVVWRVTGGVTPGGILVPSFYVSERAALAATKAPAANWAPMGVFATTTK